MKKKTVQVRELVDKYQTNCERISEIADTCEKEQRERNEAEDAEYKALSRENQLLQMRMHAIAVEAGTPQNVNTDKVLREMLLNKNSKVTISLMREVTPQTTAALADTGIIPVQEQEMLKPIRLGLIYDKVGLNIRSGLIGTLRWPKHSKAVAQFADEAERLSDSKIDWGKLETSGYRLGIAIPVTREELEDSHGIVENVVKEEMPAAIVDEINAALFTTTKDYTAKDGSTKQRKVYGPFVKAAETVTNFAAAVPTRKELLKIVAKVASSVKMIAPCWIMTEAMKAELRDVKVDEGSGRFLCENDMILGYPVFTTNAIGADYIGFGDWSYQAAGFFGDMNLVVDPYTLARNNAVDFVLNTRFGTVTLREEAFVLGKVKTA
ncbi:MAG: phage major capsid protein [Clostridia bacterium]|nr:phage major capsid protein [Clostridia bacterium]